MKRILLVDDHSMIRDALKQYLDQHPTYKVVREAENGKEALSILRKETFDLIITDINMPVMNGVEFVENLKLNYPNIPILVISMQDDERSIKRMVSLGAKGFIMKNSKREEFIKALDQIVAGKSYFSTEIVKKIKSLIQRRNDNPILNGQKLTSAEIELLKLLIKRVKPQKACEKLRITPQTFESLTKQILKKTNCKGIPGLILYAIEHDLL